MARYRTAMNDIYLLPNGGQSSDELLRLVERYKTTRLTALQLDPAAFGSTYTREIQFTYETWLSRIQNPLSKTFLSIDSTNTNQTDEIPLAQSEWVGTLTVLGPKVTSEGTTLWNTFTRENSTHTPDLAAVRNSNAIYMMAGVFVHPGYRRQGRAQRLVDAAVKRVREEAKFAGASRITIILQVNTENQAAVRLYETAGFLAVSNEKTDWRGMTWEEQLTF
ncbi:hypothetical protein BGW36DRAFT_427377 [Talaromyces proteolyticus]|uniref:N-acetyltransferase domain-containing protein n=1 Tax=Talaromyces proteolyticus TaxID=1131652 RepID=A0AAD4Q0P7_9EURO|nr:uncharacterized protein BGW36DRAFT_427377 [Talaromyces proteolyticus]KAH8697413.1 hypothetical protein BGW36DRAFT_427377 [Talaromyces proteolyticus]